MKTSSQINNRQNELLSKELQSLIETIGITEKMHQDTYLFHQEMNASKIYLVKSGLVQIEKLLDDGKMLTLRLCTSDDLIGGLAVFKNNQKYLQNAKVLKSGEVLVIDVTALQKELMQNSALSFDFMNIVSNEMNKNQYKFRDFLLKGKKGALYSTLIRLSNSYGITQNDGILIDLFLTNQEMAQLCFSTRETVNRTLANLRKKDIISIKKSGKILIKDIEFLRNKIDCERCPIDICNIN